MEVQELANAIFTKRREIPPASAMLVGISGIDACGKGSVTAKLSEMLELEGFRVAEVNADGWLNLPHIRFGASEHGVHFYENALRLDEMFEQLVLPLKENRSINITADFAEETANEFRPHNYVFDNIDIILLEGIFLFKKPYADLFDLRIWVDCSFETAMIRAIKRAQEGLTTDKTTAAYDTIYFPAQRLHFLLDSPQSASDLILQNDEKAA
ncbi:MAG: hypothetical protein WBD16_02490 [Pyrinomonadaceae bacterium]